MRIKNKAVYIVQLDGKDLVNGNYNILSFKKYKVAFDYSLDLIELNKQQKIHLPKEHNFYKNSKNKNDKKIYTDLVVSVTFNYRTDKYNTAEIREKLYRDGFYVDNKKYVRFKRSSGSSRMGKCLFIREELYKPMMEYSYIDLNIPDNINVDLASLEAYISLTTSSIVDTIKIHPENILVLDDYESVFSDQVVVTKIVDNALVSQKQIAEISNSIFDGESLLDVSVFNKNKYQNKGMLLLRNRFFKSCCFNTNIQKFFKDRGIVRVDQLNGWTLATNVSQIKLITTKSSIKYLKFGSIDNYFKYLNCDFGVVKYDKPPHFFGGRLVQTHYQLLNTLNFSKADMEQFLQESLEYIKHLKNNPEFMRFHLKISLEDNDDTLNFDTTSDFIYSMFKYNDDIIKTNIYNGFLRDTIRHMRDNLKYGHILVQGNYSTIFGNAIEFLEHSIGEFKGHSVMNVDEIITTRFPENKKILGIRSPHITMGNVWVTVNKRNKFVDKYFNLTPQIVIINSIGNNILERLNGCDFDSDTILITDNKLLVKKALQNYNNFLVPTSKVVSSKTKRYNDYKNKANLDTLTSVNKIGEIVNLSQILNSVFWELYKSNMHYKIKKELCDDIYLDICKLAVMSTIEIDKAKKEFDIDMNVELRKMREKYNETKNRIPMFFRTLDIPKTFLKNIDRYAFYETPMDYLVDIVNKSQYKIKKHRQEKLKLVDLFYTQDILPSDEYTIQYIFDAFERYKTQKNTIWQDPNITNKEKFILSSDSKKQLINELSKINITHSMIYEIITRISNNNQRLLIGILFKANPNLFYDLLKIKKTNRKEIDYSTNRKYLFKIYNIKMYEK